jgi:hypothetical protein
MWFDAESKRIRDKSKIQQIMDAHMLNPQSQNAPWLVEIFTRQYRKGGNIFVGATVLSAFTEGNEKTYQIICGDSFQLRLSSIEYVVVL